MSRQSRVLFCISLGLTFLGLVLWLLGCEPREQKITITAKPVHPNTDMMIAFTATSALEQIQTLEIWVNNVRHAECPSRPCAVVAGPFPAYGGSKIRYRGRVQDMRGKWHETDWKQLPIVTCFDEPGFTDPSQIPSSQATQTGPNLYQLTDPIVLETAIVALEEYAGQLGVNVTELDTADEYIEAVAWYVDQHMRWTPDCIRRRPGGPCVPDHNPNCINNVNDLNYAPGWDFPIPANWTLRYTGVITCGCANDYCGDCEDHAILRAALLRALGVSAHCIWDAINRLPNGGISHEYNIVNYMGAYRLMDYGPISRWLRTHDGDARITHYAWNEDNGPRGVDTIQHNYAVTGTWNYPRPDLTCGKVWTYTTYYQDACP